MQLLKTDFRYVKEHLNQINGPNTSLMTMFCPQFKISVNFTEIKNTFYQGTGHYLPILLAYHSHVYLYWRRIRNIQLNRAEGFKQIRFTGYPSCHVFEQ